MEPPNHTSRLFSLELFISKFLRYGVLFAAVLLAIGWMSQIDFQHDTFASFSDYQNVPLNSSLKKLWADSSYGLLTAYAGLAVLISLPVIRVFLTALVFVVDRDRLMAGCALLVLAGLILSLILGYEI